MSRMWLIALHEYKRQVLTKGFIAAALSVPLLIALTVGLIVIIDVTRSNSNPVGYVDLAGWLTDPISPRAGAGSLLGRFAKPVPFVSYPTAGDARQALEAGEIQAYYILSPDYLQTRSAELVYVRPPGRNVFPEFLDFLQANLLAGKPPEVAQRAAEGSFLLVRTPDGSREYSQRAELSILLPLFVGMISLILLASTSSTLLQTVAQEKEGRTVEVLLTSTSAQQLMGGNVLGIAATGLTLILVWGALIGFGLYFAGAVLETQWVHSIHLHPRTVGTILLLAVPSYVFFSAMMMALGAMGVDAQESQQLSAPFSILAAVPFYAMKVLVEQPQSLLALALSLFPPTALTTFCLRAAFGTVPTWQIGVIVGFNSLCALGAVWVAGRAFRRGMLRYGQRLDWRELFRREGVRPLDQAAGRS